MDRQTEQWHESMLEELSELGICYDTESVPVNALELDASLMETFSKDLPALANLAREASMNRDPNGLTKIIRNDYVDIANLYKEKKRAPIIMRADGILVDRQLKILELNIDSGLGGIWEVDFLQQQFSNCPDLARHSSYLLPEPKSAFLQIVKEAKNNFYKNREINLALVGREDYDQYYKDQAYEICHWIKEEIGVNACFCFPEMLRVREDFISDGQRQYDIIYRDSCVLHSPQKSGPLLELLKIAATTKTLVLSDPVDLLIEQKEILSFLYAAAHQKNNILSKQEKELVKRYVPLTRSLAHVEDKEKAIAFLNARKDYFVLKQCYSHAGEKVFIGEEIEMAAWVNLVKKVVYDSTNNWVYQKNIKSKPYNFRYRSGQGHYISKPQRYTLNPFVFGEHLGGMLVRIEKDKKQRVLALPTNSEMGAVGVVVI